MHTLLIHPNFPSQFGNLALALANRPGDRVTFLTSVAPQCGPLPFDVLTYRVGDRPIPTLFSEQFTHESNQRHALAIVECLRECPDVRPDVVVGHASYGTWLYLRPMYEARFIAYHEMIPPSPWEPDFDLRPDYPATEGARQFNMIAHAHSLLHLHYADAGYTPTYHQLRSAPRWARHKLEVIHDGIPTDLFCRHDPMEAAKRWEWPVDDGDRVVTYLARGFESYRGFDIFYRAALQIARDCPKAVFLVAGQDRVVYGHDLSHTNGRTFVQHCVHLYGPPPERMHFLGMIPATALMDFYSVSDCHVYWTVPWVLSWSMVQAMSCAAPLVVSDTEPCRELIDSGVNGVRVPFGDHELLAAHVCDLLAHPDRARELGARARQTIKRGYSTDVCIPRIVKLLEGR